MQEKNKSLWAIVTCQNTTQSVLCYMLTKKCCFFTEMYADLSCFFMAFLECASYNKAIARIRDGKINYKKEEEYEK